MNKIKDFFRYTKNLKTIILILVLFGILNGINSQSMINGYTSFYQTIINNFFQTNYLAAIFMGMLFATIETVILSKKDYSHLIRYKNKEKYLENLIKVIFKKNFVIYVISFATVMIVISIRALFNNCSITDIYYYYQMPDYIYLIFSFIKVYLILQLIMAIILLVWTLFPKIYTILLSFGILFDLFLFSDFISINKISDINFHLHIYITPISYPSFMMEVCAYSFYCIILMVIVFILNYLFNKKSIDIGD